MQLVIDFEINVPMLRFMARYNTPEAIDKHHFIAMAKTLRHYAERFDSLATSMETREIQVMAVTHFKSVTQGLEKIQKFLNASMAAHERMLLAEVNGKDAMTEAAFRDRFPGVLEKGGAKTQTDGQINRLLNEAGDREQNAADGAKKSPHKKKRRKTR